MANKPVWQAPARHASPPVQSGGPYLRMMALAGYLDEAQLAEARILEASLMPHPLADQRLTSKEWRAVGSFIKKLVAER